MNARKTAPRASLSASEWSDLLWLPEIREAIDDVERARAKRDSVHRKRAARSSAFTADDERFADGQLAAVRATLEGLAEFHAPLSRHPLLTDESPLRRVRAQRPKDGP